jgi:nitrous oxidase accessory protein NosD
MVKQTSMSLIATIARSKRFFLVPLAALALIASGAPPASAHDSRLVVQPGESIQAAVDRAHPGDTIVVLPGTYRQNVVVMTNGLKLVGYGARLVSPAAPKPNFCADPGQPATIGICVAGQFDPNTGEVTTPVKNVTVAGFTFRDYPDAGVLAFGAKHATFRDNTARNDNEYGITAFVSSGTRMLHNRVTGADEAGFYIGDSPDADAALRGNVVTDSRFGILFRNADHGMVARNLVTRNCVGVIALSGIKGLEGLAGDLTVRHNLVARNTRACEESEEGPALSGVGVALVGAHDSRVIHNLVVGNVPTGPTAFSGGVAVVTDFLGTAPQDNRVAGNVLRRNDPDLFWDGTGSRNTFRHNECRTSHPGGLCRH